MEELAFVIDGNDGNDVFVAIQSCEDGYDYSIADKDYKLIDGGVYDDPDISIFAALAEILEDIGISGQVTRMPIDYEELMEKVQG